MKQPIILMGILILLLTSCEKDDGSIKTIRNSFLIVGDTTGCNHFDYTPDIVFDSESDLFDINFDGKYDVEIEINDVFIDCDEFLDTCPPDVICDCWPTIYIDYIINLASGIEIAIDTDSTIHEFMLNDTISDSNIWTSHTKYPLFHRTPYDVNWIGYYELFLGLRKIQNLDTLLSWINIRIENPDLYIKEAAIQK
jgi:hypothetical protein